MKLTESLMIELPQLETEQILKQINQIITKTSARNSGLFSGSIGRIVYYFYLANFYRDESIADRGVSLLEEVLSQIQTGTYAYPKTYSLSGGLAGLGMALTILKEEDILEIDFEDNLRFFDQQISPQALEELHAGNTDYLHGAIGSLHYLTMRHPYHSELAQVITAMIDVLHTLAVKKGEGICFPNRFIEQNNNTLNTNLGMAHGQCGIIMTLLKVYQRGIAQSVIRSIVTQTIQYMLDLQIQPDIESGRVSHFPLTFDTTQAASFQTKEYSSRLGWCYGDLNQCLTLYHAGSILNRPDWIEIADRVGFSTVARRNRLHTLITDANFCHGAIGVAQTYRRLFEMTQQDLYLEAYQYWIDQTLLFTRTVVDESDYLPYAGEFLGGGIGVSLGLMSALGRDELNWDRIFLLC
ncbi:lanthionine synthetase LanC family protein [Cytophagaceae bacterium YF14B1]|uniref:Lanthionine synthetase LanC family protein n=1 Tax=Xanthocytophaga flava TaxID=3048013 RepID=A0AAE3QY43_9BACT|nr:lanthionine synthetase LanC family protein [Xanthocytophaga flavus]MDJ1485593.1 lanthionine synthetase LanC family protein [Xanthocytophaga flavus]